MKVVLTRIPAAALALTMAGAALPAAAETVVVEMRNQGSDGTPMVFEPAVVEIDPGDTVHFKATDLGHNVESLDGMTPDEAVSFKSGINEGIKVTFDEPGIHPYRCLPHYVMGMVGVVKVGDGGDNMDKIRAGLGDVPRLARKRFKTYLDAID